MSLTPNRQPKHALSTEESTLLLAIAESIAGIENSEGWKHFERAAEHLIQQAMPNYTSFTSEQATVIASKMTYINGIKDCLALVKNNKKRAAELKALKTKEQQ